MKHTDGIEDEIFIFSRIDAVALSGSHLHLTLLLIRASHQSDFLS